MGDTKMTQSDETAFSDALSKLRAIQAKRHKLTLKRNKTDRDFERIDQYYDTEEKLYDTLQAINPEWLDKAYR